MSATESKTTNSSPLVDRNSCAELLHRKLTDVEDDTSRLLKLLAAGVEPNIDVHLISLSDGSDRGSRVANHSDAKIETKHRDAAVKEVKVNVENKTSDSKKAVQRQTAPAKVIASKNVHGKAGPKQPMQNNYALVKSANDNIHNHSVEKQSMNTMEDRGRHLTCVISPFIAKDSPLDATSESSSISDQEFVTRLCKLEGALLTLKSGTAVRNDQHNQENKNAIVREKLTELAAAYETRLNKLELELSTVKKDAGAALQGKLKAEETCEKLEQKLNDSHQTVTYLRSELNESGTSCEKLMQQVTSLREELARESSLCMSLESSQAVLMSHVNEMDELVRTQRNELRSARDECDSLKQRLTEVNEQILLEQHAKIENEQRFNNLQAGKVLCDERLETVQAEKDLLLSEMTKLQSQFTDLIRQLDQTKTIVNDRKMSQDHLEEANEQLKTELQNCDKRLSEVMTECQQRVQRVIEEYESSSEIARLRVQLKDAETDKNLSQQRCTQLHHQVENLRSELNSKECELSSMVTSSRQEANALRTSIAAIEEEKDSVIKDRELLIEKLTHVVGCLTQEKTTLTADLHAIRVELQALTSSRRQLERDNQRLIDTMSEYKQKQKSFDSFERSLGEMMEERTKLSYENGLLIGQLEQLRAELNCLPALQAELGQLQKNSTAVQTRNTTLHMELTSCRTHTQQLESQLAQAQCAAERHEKDFELAIAARDKAVAEKQSLAEDKRQLMKTHRQTVDSMELAIARSRDDNIKLSSTVETLMTSHSALQLTLDSVRSELGQKDSLIEKLTREKSQAVFEQKELEKKVANLEGQLTSQQESANFSVAPLRRDVQRSHEDNRKLVETMETLLQCNEELKSAVACAEETASKKMEETEDIKQIVKRMEEQHEVQLKLTQEQANKLSEQLDRLSKDKDISSKKSKSEMNDVRQQLAEAQNTCTELRRSNVTLRQRLVEREQQVKELRQPIVEVKGRREQLANHNQREADHNKHGTRVSKPPDISTQLAELERVNEEYSEKIKQQYLLIEDLMKQLDELKVEIKALRNAAVKYQTTDRKVSGNEHRRHRRDRHHRQENVGLLDSCSPIPRTDPIQSERLPVVRSDQLELILKELQLSRSYQLQSQQLLEEDKKKAEQTVERATSVVAASHKALNCLASYAESSKLQSELERSSITQQLEEERARVLQLEARLNQVQATSLRHTEMLARELHRGTLSSSADIRTFIGTI